MGNVLNPKLAGSGTDVAGRPFWPRDLARLVGSGSVLVELGRDVTPALSRTVVDEIDLTGIDPLVIAKLARRPGQSGPQSLYVGAAAGSGVRVSRKSVPLDEPAMPGYRIDACGIGAEIRVNRPIPDGRTITVETLTGKVAQVRQRSLSAILAEESVLIESASTDPLSIAFNETWSRVVFRIIEGRNLQPENIDLVSPTFDAAGISSIKGKIASINQRVGEYRREEKTLAIYREELKEERKKQTDVDVQKQKVDRFLRQLLSDREALIKEIYEIAKGPKPTRKFKNLLAADYAQDAAALEALWDEALGLQDFHRFLALFKDESGQATLREQIQALGQMISEDEKILEERVDILTTADIERINLALTKLKDTHYELTTILADIKRIRTQMLSEGEDARSLTDEGIAEYYSLSTLINVMNNLEVRGRDSLGVCQNLTFSSQAAYQTYRAQLMHDGLDAEFQRRTVTDPDTNLFETGSILIREQAPDGPVVVSFVYKVAAPVGELGYNTSCILTEIQGDKIFKAAIKAETQKSAWISHTRWASVGEITQCNCHQVQSAVYKDGEVVGHVVAALNGDIENYTALREEYERLAGRSLPREITTDTQIIPAIVALHLQQAMAANTDPQKGPADFLDNAVRNAMRIFEGSFAIEIATNLAPGKLYVARRGDGQAVYVGLRQSGHYVVASEVYGVVAGGTQRYIGLQDREMAVLDQDSSGGPENVRMMRFSGEEIPPEQIRVDTTNVTRRDLALEGFPRYFLKEIHGSRDSIVRTLRGKLAVVAGKPIINVGPEIIPEAVLKEIESGQRDEIIVTGMGSAKSSADAIAEILKHYCGRRIKIHSMLATAVSAYVDKNKSKDMSKVIILAVSQSGVTAETNTPVKYAKDKHARVISIVNRRDSDLSHPTKCDGVFYTAGGKDPEMAVASTKAMHSQSAAGVVLGLKFAEACKVMTEAELAAEIQRVLKYSDGLKGLLEDERRKETDSKLVQQLKAAARVLRGRQNWAIHAQGRLIPAAGEGRTKLGELGYKTTGICEPADAKHMDYSSHAARVILAVGCDADEYDAIKTELNYMLSHNNPPILICDANFTKYLRRQGWEGLERINVIEVPPIAESPVWANSANMIMAQLLAYYTAMAINESSDFIGEIINDLASAVKRVRASGTAADEGVLQAQEFSDLAKNAYHQFVHRGETENLFQNALPTQVSMLVQELLCAAAYGTAAPNLIQRVNRDPIYLGGSAGNRHKSVAKALPDGVQITATMLLQRLFTVLNFAREYASRNGDTIREQAKTVTVGQVTIGEAAEFKCPLFHYIHTLREVGVTTFANLEAFRAVHDTFDLLTGTNRLAPEAGYTRLRVQQAQGDIKVKEDPHSREGANNSTSYGTDWGPAGDARLVKAIERKRGVVFIEDLQKDKDDPLFTIAIPGIDKEGKVVELHIFRGRMKEISSSASTAAKQTIFARRIEKVGRQRGVGQTEAGEVARLLTWQELALDNVTELAQKVMARNKIQIPESGKFIDVVKGRNYDSDSRRERVSLSDLRHLDRPEDALEIVGILNQAGVSVTGSRVYEVREGSLGAPQAKVIQNSGWGSCPDETSKSFSDFGDLDGIKRDAWKNNYIMCQTSRVGGREGRKVVVIPFKEQRRILIVDVEINEAELKLTKSQVFSSKVAGVLPALGQAKNLDQSFTDEEIKALFDRMPLWTVLSGRHNDLAQRIGRARVWNDPRRQRVLYLEDAEVMRTLYTPVIGEGGRTVTVAISIKEARTAMESGEFDILVLDFELPDGNIFNTRLVAELRERYPQAILIINSQVMSGDARSAIDQLGGIVIPKEGMTAASFMKQLTQAVAKKLTATLMD